MKAFPAQIGEFFNNRELDEATIAVSDYIQVSVDNVVHKKELYTLIINHTLPTR